MKQLKERLVKRHQIPDLRKIADVNVLCSFVKDFLINLNEHLVTYNSWHRFAKAIGKSFVEKIQCFEVLKIVFFFKKFKTRMNDKRYFKRYSKIYPTRIKTHSRL